MPPERQAGGPTANRFTSHPGLTPWSQSHGRCWGDARQARTVGAGEAVIMGMWSLGHGAPDPKPPLPPPLPVRAQPELVISRLLVGQTGRIAHRSDRKS